ncbi:MAG: class I SAM-dependent rRNA methyltransferase [Pikeienuella sp.]
MSDAPAPRPTVKLRPGKGRRLSEGAPWAYADEIAMDRRTRALTSGSVVRREDRDGPLGAFALNSESQIAARFLDADPDVEIGAGWFADRLRRAIRLRQVALGAEAAFCRLVHAEGDGLPGLVLDRYGPAIVIQPNAAWLEPRLPTLIAGLDTALSETGAPPAQAIVVNAQSRVRKLEGLETRLEVVRGTVSAPVPVEMNGATYLADLHAGQKTGLFYDQRENHAMAARIAAALGPDARILDVFSHVGGFGLACLAAAPDARVTAIDSSEPALALARTAANLRGLAERYDTRRADAFDAMAQAAAAQERYGLVICDPPTFAPAKPALEAGLRAYERTARRAAGLVTPEGWLMLCSCSGAVSAEAFRSACAAGIRKAGRYAALVRSGRAGPDHPQHPALPETGYLKALLFRLAP